MFTKAYKKKFIFPILGGEGHTKLIVHNAVKYQNHKRWYFSRSYQANNFYLWSRWTAQIVNYDDINANVA